MRLETDLFDISIKIPLHNCNKIPYKEDCLKIVNECKKHNLILTIGEADYLWSEISDKKYAAGWMNLDHMDIWEEISSFIERDIVKALSNERDLYNDYDEDYKDVIY